ncbi:helix-turn-helix domain-containing protein [Paenibacillus filicis]|uniref:Helix-turn-helix domain-containing protein n=1 Tax=Paenibacillus filicis TaxID=669464 RepID=A0ABU9DE60_9BACL
MNVCPYMEYTFSILGKKWNGLILYDLSLRPHGAAHFSEIKKNLTDITPRALSLKLSELMEYGLIDKRVTASTPVVITYELTEKGRSLTAALRPIQAWAQQYKPE